MRRAAVWALAAAVALGGCSDAVLGPAAATDRGAIFDQLWHEFDLHYSFFEYKDVNWDTLGAIYRPPAVAAKSDADFATQIGSMLRQLKDVHVSLTPSGPGSTLAYVSAADTATTHFNSGLVYSQYVPGALFSSGQHLKFGLAAPTVGYVRIPSFDGAGWDGELDEALDSMPQVTSLIIDVRNNYGGNQLVATQLAGRFTEMQRRFGWIRLRNGPKHDDFTDFQEETVSPAGSRAFRGAVYVLTNRRDFSSAEDFVLAMQVIPRVTIVGDTTAGASGGPIPRELANGWSYELSEWIEYLPSKRMFEGVGLAPDVFIRASSADAAAGIDRALERALALAR